MDNIDMIEDIVRKANLKMHAKVLEIPVVSGFEVIKIDNPQTIFFAVDGRGFTQQMTSDGTLALGETLESRAALVIKNVVDFMKENGDEEADKHFFHIKDYENGVFKFKIYIQDIAMQGQAIRMITAFFREPRFNDFYQMSISVGPFDCPVKSYSMGKFDEEKEPISKLLLDMMMSVLSELKYKD